MGSAILFATCLCSGITTLSLDSGLGSGAAWAQTSGLAQVDNWRYDSEKVRLEVNTQGDVRPSLFILQDPPRVVLDFPNTEWGAAPKHIPQIGRVQSLRISQLDPTTTRFVLTLERSFDLSLDQLQLQTAGPKRWAVRFINAEPLAYSPRPFDQAEQILLGSRPTPAATTEPRPTPTPNPGSAGQLPPPPTTLSPLTALPQPTTTLAPITPPRANSPVPPSASAPAFNPGSSSLNTTQLLGITPTSNGFLVRTSGPAAATIRRITDPDRIVVDFLDTTVSKGLTQRSLTINQLGVFRLRIGQFEPTVARVVLDVDQTSGDWETRYDPQQGGVVLVPAGGSSQASLLPDQPSNFEGPVATITNVNLVGNQLMIVADGFLFYRSGWEPASGGYRISVKPARLPQSLPDPGLPADGPIDRIRFRQETEDTVSILVQPSKDFNVIEPSPGQGARQITLLVQALDGSTPVVSAPVSPGAPTNAIPGQPLVAIDPGHGGRDPGAVANGLLEKTLNLNVSFKVAQLLQAEGIGVIMTRTDDREILLQPRVDTAVQAGASILVSIHHNALDRSGVNGIETYYLRPDSERLASTLHRSIVASSGGTDRGVRRARFFMVRVTPTTMPSVLLELGYMTNPAEASRLATDEYQTILAQSIANGIKAYFRGQP